MNKNLWLLAVCQGLFLTNNVTFIAINGLVGLSLAPFGWMATLPVMGYVVTLLVRNRPWQTAKSHRFLFIASKILVHGRQWFLVMPAV